MEHLKPISSAPEEDWRALQFVFCDIDDTLTTEGRLGATAYTMLERLHDDGLSVIPVTGRPAGWCDMIARFWPVAAVVGENGAFYFRYLAEQRRMKRVFAQTSQERIRHRTQLDAIRNRILTTIQGAAVASDQAYREADLAIDFCEDVPRLADADIARIVSTFETAGATAKISSIHVNGWFGQHNKLAMTRRLMTEEFGLDIDDNTARLQCAFIGDSPNDAPMFGCFENSVGVANLIDFIDQCEALPRWVTTAVSGAGFCEFGETILSARKSAV